MTSALKQPVRRPSIVTPRRTLALNLKHESLYIYWTRFGIKNDLLTSDISAVDPRVVDKLIFQQKAFAQEYVETLAKILKIDCSLFRRLCGDDMRRKSGEVLALHDGLRFCFKCLEAGYHSVIYQHLAISNCPLHGCRFEFHCRSCGSLIEPTFKSALLSPFECHKCNQPFVSTVANPFDAADKDLADQMADGRRAGLWRGNMEAGTLRRLLQDPLVRQTKRQVSLGRAVQRWALWESPSDPLWIRFPLEQISLAPGHNRGEFNASDSLDVGLAAERTVIWILKQLSWADSSSLLMLSNRMGRRPQGLRINADVTLIGAACYKLLVAYDLVQEAAVLIDHRASDLNAKARVCYGRSMQQYGDAASEYPKLNYRLMQLEMLSLFAKLLIEARNGQHLFQLSWVDLPHPSEFAPAWTVKKSGDLDSADVRSRANEKFIQRLLKRQQGKRLTYQHKKLDGLWRNNWINSTWYCPENPAKVG